MNEKLCIAFITDDNYAIPTGIAISSLIENYSGENKLHIYVGTVRINDDKKQAFCALSNDKVNVELLEVDDSCVKGFEKYKGSDYITLATYLRACLPRLLPQYDKILYLDGDILVRKDLTPFLQTDIEGYYAAVIADMAAIKVLHWDERLHRMRYFNAGVMLMNAKRLREENMEEKFFRARVDHPEFICADQDILNFIYEDETKYLPLRWNLMMYNIIISNFSVNEVNTLYRTDYSSLEEMENDAAIIHLTNAYKPWKYKGAYMGDAWLDAFRRSPFAKFDLVLQELPENAMPKKEEKSIVSRKGIFRKVWTKEKTTLSLCGIPVAKKLRLNNVVTVKVLGFPVAKRMHDALETRTRYFGLLHVRKPNYGVLRARMDGYWKQILDQVENPFNNVSIHLSRQISALDSMRAGRSKKKQEGRE